jgi:syntaxin-binding protein 1
VPSQGGAPRPPPGGQRVPGRPPPPQGGLPAGPRLGGAPIPPTQQMASMNLNSRPPNGVDRLPSSSGEKPHKLEKEKKKRNFLGMKKS